MEFIAEYAGFLARTVTVLAAIIVVLVVIVALRGRGRRGAGGHLDVQKLNEADAANRLMRLAKEIARHDRLYHDRDAPEISDAEYDALVRENRELEERFRDTLALIVLADHREVAPISVTFGLGDAERLVVGFRDLLRHLHVLLAVRRG